MGYETRIIPPEGPGRPDRNKPGNTKEKNRDGGEHRGVHQRPSLRHFNRGRVVRTTSAGGGGGRGFHETSLGGAGDNIQSSHWLGST
jgi:hypothetical protein